MTVYILPATSLHQPSKQIGEALEKIGNLTTEDVIQDALYTLGKAGISCIGDTCRSKAWTHWVESNENFYMDYADFSSEQEELILRATFNYARHLLNILDQHLDNDFFVFQVELINGDVHVHA